MPSLPWLLPFLLLSGEDTPPTKPLERLRTRLTEATGLRLSGFGDASLASTSPRFQWGTLELDGEAELHEDLQAALAITRDREGLHWPVGFLDFNPFGGTVAPRGRLSGVQSLHVQVGRFDVPFGSDWQYFASKDSTSMARPLGTEVLMEGGANDLGLRILGDTGTLSHTAYVLKGSAGGRRVGGRLGLSPLENPYALGAPRGPHLLEFGLSGFQDLQSRERGLALDLEVNLASFTLRGEWLERRSKPWRAKPGRLQRAWHLGFEKALPWTGCQAQAYGRWERILEPGTGPGDARIVAGLRLGLREWLLLKVEGRHHLWSGPMVEEEPSLGSTGWFAQCVVVF